MEAKKLSARWIAIEPLTGTEVQMYLEVEAYTGTARKIQEEILTHVRDFQTYRDPRYDSAVIEGETK